MRAWIDRVTASDADLRRVDDWSDYALRRFGSEAARQLQASLNGPAKVKSRKALRMTIRRVKLRLRHRIHIAPASAARAIQD